MPTIELMTRPSRRPRYRRASDGPPLRLGRPHRHLLEAIACLPYLSASQLAQLLFSRGSLTYVRACLAELYHAGFVVRVLQPTTAPHGSAPILYTLDRRGMSYLRAAGFAAGARFRPSEDRSRQGLFLRHTVATNDLLVLLLKLLPQDPSVRLVTLLTERQLKRRPLRVADASGVLTVIPDAWAALRSGQTQACLAFEVDCGTTERKRFQRKIRALVYATRGAYQAAFKTESLTVAVVVAGLPLRLQTLLAWTEAELRALGEPDQADLFRFGLLDPNVSHARNLFCAPVWWRPFSSAPLPLLSWDVGGPTS